MRVFELSRESEHAVVTRIIAVMQQSLREQTTGSTSRFPSTSPVFGRDEDTAIVRKARNDFGDASSEPTSLLASADRAKGNNQNRTKLLAYAGLGFIGLVILLGLFLRFYLLPHLAE